MLGAVAHQAAGLDGLARGIARGQPHARAANATTASDAQVMNEPEPTSTASARLPDQLPRRRVRASPDAADIDRIMRFWPDSFCRRLHVRVSSGSVSVDIRIHQHGDRRRPCGTSWRSSSNRFAPNLPLNNVTPVTLPPGRLRLATRPSLTGSPPAKNTIGTVVVAALAASAAGDSATNDSHRLADQVSRPESPNGHGRFPPSGFRS